MKFNLTKLPLISVAIIIACLIRIVTYFLMFHYNGWFFGIPWDSFDRSIISYNWSIEPFIIQQGGYWLPLQFYVIGSIFKLVSPIISTLEISVPIIVNNIFFIISLALISKITLKIKNIKASILSIFIASFFYGDIFVSFSALSEPILISIFLATIYSILKIDDKNQIKTKQFLLIIFLTALLQMTHIIGWSIVFVYLVLCIKYRKNRQFLFILFFSFLIPTIWMALNMFQSNDAYYLFNFARSAQMPYLGDIDIGNRLRNFILSFATYYPFLTLLSFSSLVYFFKKRILVDYAIFFLIIFLFLLLTTICGMSNPYQEPRYFVLIFWIAIPFVSLFINDLFSEKNIYKKAFAIFIICFLIYTNASYILSSKNSFSNKLLLVGNEIRFIENKYGNNLPIYVEVKEKDRLKSYEQYGVLPAISGYPNLFSQDIRETLLEKIKNKNFGVYLFQDNHQLLDNSNSKQIYDYQLIVIN